MTRAIFTPLVAVILAGGIIPGLYFVWTWRPPAGKRLDWRTLDAGGWVWGLLILYVWSALSLVLRESDHVPTWTDVTLTVLLGGALDALLVLRALRWHRVRKTVL